MGTTIAKPKEDVVVDPFVTPEVQIVKIEDKVNKNQRSFKLVHFSDGAKVYAWDKLKGLDLGSFGRATVLADEKDGKTFLNLKAWEQTKPPGRVPEYSKEPSGKQVEQAVWDAKDRTFMMENAGKVAAPIVSAMIAAGVVKDLAKIIGAFDAIRVCQYEACSLARADRVATAANPFASE